jgi:hypothetical protein
MAKKRRIIVVLVPGIWENQIRSQRRIPLRFVFLGSDPLPAWDWVWDWMTPGHPSVTQGSRLGRFVQVSLFAMKDEKRAGWGVRGGADPSGPIWLLCPFTPKVGANGGPKAQPNLRTSRDGNSQVAAFFKRRGDAENSQGRNTEGGGATRASMIGKRKTLRNNAD